MIVSIVAIFMFNIISNIIINIIVINNIVFV